MTKHFHELQKIEWFDKHSKGTEILFNIHYELRDYAKAFRVVGNETMYQVLMAISKEILEAHKMIRDAIGESISEDCERTQQNTTTMLEAVFAGITLEKGH